MAGRAEAAAKRSAILPSWAHELPSEWGWCQLADACLEIVDCPHSTPELVEGGPYLMARTPDILTGVFRADQARRVSEGTYRERTRRVEPKYGDLLYSREGTYFGLAAEIPAETKVCLGQRMVLLRPDTEQVHPTYLRYWLNSSRIQSHIQGHRDGSVAERLNLPTIRRLPVCTPSMREQRAIAHTLGALDDKIELSRQMNETMEAIARTVFRSWFVDFDPVRVKAKGRDPGLPKPLADLFPDSFEDSELGEIPRGWRVGTVGELATLSREGINPGEFPNETFDHFSIPAFDEGRQPKIEIGAAIKSNKTLVSGGEVLLSKLNPRIPRIWLPVVRHTHRAICSTEFLVTLPQAGISREFLYSFLSSDVFAAVFETLVTGTSGSHQRVTPGALLNMDALLPDGPLVDEFTSAVRTLLMRVDRARQESATLAILRDTLLPKLVSGALRVKPHDS